MIHVAKRLPIASNLLYPNWPFATRVFLLSEIILLSDKNTATDDKKLFNLC